MALYDDIQNQVKVQPKKTAQTASDSVTTTPTSAPIVKVGRTTTGLPGTPANVSVTGTSTLNFTIPEGIPGVSGVPGPEGAGINILGELNDTSQLPESAFQGDAYTIDGELWIWTDDEGGAWNNAGQFRGPQGPAGPPGADGTQGVDGAPGPAATIAVGNTATSAAGSNASVTNSGNSSSAIFNFVIPRGADGANGAPGVAATISVGTVTTGAAGSNATITNAGNSSSAVFNFTIPRGDPGAAANTSDFVTIGTSQTITGAKVFSSALRVDATAGQNGHYYIRDDLGVNQGLFYWDRATDQVVLRRYNDAGSSAEGQILISNAAIRFDSPRLQADFGNANLALRTIIQSNVTNGSTTFSVMPNGTSTVSNILAYGGSDPANANYLFFGISGTTALFSVGKAGTGVTPTSLGFRFDNVEKLAISNTGWILADFSSAAGVRAQVQTSVANSPTNLTVVPSGTGVQSLFSAFNTSNAANGAAIQVGSDDTQAYVNTARTGTAVGVPLNLRIEGTTVLQLANTGTVINVLNSATINFNNAVRQHITLWNTSANSSYGIGVQNSAWYARSDAAFAFYNKGNHHADKFNAGTTGALLFSIDLDSNGYATAGFGGVPGGTTTGVIVHRGAIGTQQGHYALASGGNRLWQIGIETDRSFKLWEYSDAGAFTSTALTIVRGASVMIAPTSGMYLYSGWFRSQQSGTGWYHEAHAGGWFMNDNSWIRNYNNKPICITNGADNNVARWESPAPTMEWYDTNEGYTSWFHFNSGQHGYLQHNAFAWAAYRTSGNEWHCVGNIVAYASDARLKKNAVPVRDSLLDSFFDGIEIEEYDWDYDAINALNPGFNPTQPHEVGGLAQKFELVYPGMVHTHNRARLEGQVGEDPQIKTLMWEKATPFLIAEVQRLRKRITELENK